MIMKKEIPIWEKTNLTLQEAAQYTGIGVNRLRKISSAENCPFVLWVGSKRLLKREALDKDLNKEYSI